MTGKELFELSERFHAKCEETLNEGECTGCEFRGEKSGVKFPCPEFYFRTEEQADDFLEFIGVDPEPGMIVGEAIMPYKLTSPHFVDCTFNDCEIYCHDLT